MHFVGIHTAYFELLRSRQSVPPKGDWHSNLLKENVVRPHNVYSHPVRKTIAFVNKGRTDMRFIMRLLLAVLSLAFGLLAPAAFASPINPDVTFSLNGASMVWTQSVTGTLTVNTVTGTIVSANIDVDGIFDTQTGQDLNFVFNSGPAQGADYLWGTDNYGFEIGSQMNGGGTFDLELPVTSLVGYTGALLSGSF